MLGKIAKTIFGSANDRFIKRQYKIVQKINSLETNMFVKKFLFEFVALFQVNLLS